MLLLFDCKNLAADDKEPCENGGYNGADAEGKNGGYKGEHESDQTADPANGGPCLQKTKQTGNKHDHTGSSSKNTADIQCQKGRDGQTDGAYTPDDVEDADHKAKQFLGG